MRCVTGFVPSNLVPTNNPTLHPLVQEIKDGFIDGYLVEHKGGIPGFQPEKVVIRHLLLCWTGDYPALVVCHHVQGVSLKGQTFLVQVTTRSIMATVGIMLGTHGSREY